MFEILKKTAEKIVFASFNFCISYIYRSNSAKIKTSRSFIKAALI